MAFYQPQQHQKSKSGQLYGDQNLPFFPQAYNTSSNANLQGNISSQPAAGYGYPSSQGDISSELGQLSLGILAAFGTGGYAGEPSLMEELGINFGHIKSKTLAVLNFVSGVDQNIMDDTDLAGPILFCLLFGTFLLLSGKVHFGYIYGVAVMGSVVLHWILKMMASNQGMNYTRTVSVLGYSILPLVLVSALGVVTSIDNNMGYVLSVLAVCWCTHSSSSIFIAVLQLSDMRALVAYPLVLFYAVFAIMSIFAEKAVVNSA
ncbi:Yip1-domain-containing protein [Nadsonia fulvescens var. elongata DSM 6958]|uniref:Protein YIP n=1 Tax=Nadsonia fulvescens var. elongata DSM 6958 TaxID=857566 RepID=A0A1E3PMM9_9ASCO|nr:Yip1-domain-containing protein [Nadsonia fulvescens var. elongata DSM 6958]